MSTSTATLTESSPALRQIHSISSATSIHSPQPSYIARVYKQASQLFVTRRIKEALETLEPLIQIPEPSPQDDVGGDTLEGADSQAQQRQAAPISTGSRGARVKVWSLYISIVNEIIELGSQEGKQVFGAKAWKEFATKARDASIWTEIVDSGYNGMEGDVDAEVVANLATLLLAHAPNQKVTQHRLETYLSTGSNPSLDVSGHLQRQKQGQQSHTNGTSTPRDLNSRLKILEIYTLHVLPRNSEWEYAREFINMSEVLDEERREAFLQALQNIQDEKTFDSRREQELQKQREQQLEDARRRDEEARKARQAKSAEPAQTNGSTRESQKISENDYGVDHTSIGHRSPIKSRPASSQPQPGKSVTNSRRPPEKPNREHRPPSRHIRPAPPTMLRRFAFLIHAIQNGVVAMGQNVRSHPMVLLRLLAFMVTLVMALSRRDIRDRIVRARDASWDKLKRTVGMGVKVSYI